MSKRRAFPVDRLEIVAPASVFRFEHEPPVGVGSVVRLNSGGPRMLVVDIDGDSLTTAWRGSDGGITEATLPRLCVHRCREI